MDIQTIGYLISLGLDVVVALVVFFRCKGKVDTTTVEQLAQKAQEKADKYFAKQCKKHNLKVEDKGAANVTQENETKNG